MPERFHFAVKLPRTITHVRRLVEAEGLLRQFLCEVARLGPKLGPLMIQLPPSLRFDPNASPGFLRTFLDIHAGSIVCEPRPARWFAHDVGALLPERRIARGAADPAPVPGDVSRARYVLRYEGLRRDPLARNMRKGVDPTMVQTWCERATRADAWMGSSAAALQRSHGRSESDRRRIAASHSAPLDDGLYGFEPTILHLTRFGPRCYRHGIYRYRIHRLREIGGGRETQRLTRRAIDGVRSDTTDVACRFVPGLGFRAGGARWYRCPASRMALGRGTSRTCLTVNYASRMGGQLALH